MYGLELFSAAYDLGGGSWEFGKESSGSIKYREYFLLTERSSPFSRRTLIRVVTMMTETFYRLKIS